MKKLILIALASILAFSFCSCTNDNAQNDESDTSSTVTETVEDSEKTESVTAKTYTVTLDNGKTFVLGASATELVADLGDPINLMEAPSCIHEGNDMVYTYDAFSIMTSPDGNGDQYLAELSFLSDAVAFDNGVTIGSSVSDVEAAFGNDCTEQFGVRTYELDGATLSIVLDGDTVTGITVSSAA